MKRRTFLKTTGMSGLAVLADRFSWGQAPPAAPPSGVMAPVTTRAFDNSRSGANLNETVLTQANVKARGIKRYASINLQGDARGIEAQPLILPRVTMANGVVRDVLLLASMNNSVWAFDANTLEQLWTQTLGVPVNGGVNIDMHTINDHWGLLSTGVIDPDTQRWYGVAWISPNGDPAKAMHFLHTLNLKDGSHAAPSVSLANVTYQPPNGRPLQSYNSTMRKQRSSLVMTKVNGKKMIFFASGTVLETTDGAAGWIIAFDPASNTIPAALAMSGGHGAGVWMAGQGLCADNNGFLYGMTGNGSFDGVTDFAETIFKAQYTPASGAKKASLSVVDWWCPYTDAGRLGENPTLSSPSAITANKLSGVHDPTSGGHMPVNMASERNTSGAVVAGHFTVTKPAVATAGFGDEDLGSAGLSLIPEYGVALGSGKDGIAYLVNMNNMGKTKPADFANAANNYSRLKQPPIWYTYFPGFNVNAAPQDPSQLDFIFDNKTRHMHSTSVRYNSPKNGMMLFCWGENSQLRAWQMASNGAMTFLAASAEVASVNSTNPGGGMPGGFMTLSANGATPGTALLWASIPYGDANQTVTAGRLLCYDPENFITLPDGSKQLAVLWDSERWAVTFDHNKFNVPVVSGGKIFVPTYDDRVDVYMLS
jgi:hypothetical protein